MSESEQEVYQRARRLWLAASLKRRADPDLAPSLGANVDATQTLGARLVLIIRAFFGAHP
jgi:hypothetical protein